MSQYIKQRLPKSLDRLRRAWAGGKTLAHPASAQDCSLNGVEHLARFDDKTGRLQVHHDEGFFSVCTVTLQALTALHPRANPVSVSWSGQRIWSEGTSHPDNLFEVYFAPSPDVRVTELKFVPRFNYDWFYEDLPFAKFTPYVRKYYSPAPVVRQRIADFKRKYAIDPARTIGFWYRGTDKAIEVSTINVGPYFKKLRNALQAHPDYRVLVQTDQRQVRDRTLMEFGEKAFFIEELPVTDSSTGFHLLTEAERKLSGFELGVNMLAAVQIHAECAYVVTHTGNVGLWTHLFRGHARNCCQLRPRKPEIASQLDFDPPWLEGVKRWGRRILRF